MKGILILSNNYNDMKDRENAHKKNDKAFLGRQHKWDLRYLELAKTIAGWKVGRSIQRWV